MTVPILPGDAGTQENIIGTNEAIRQINNITDKALIYKDETGTRRVIVDKDGLRTTPSGFDVLTAEDSQLSFNSNQNVFKIVLSGTLTFDQWTVATGTTTSIGAATSANNFFEVVHGLTGKLSVLAWGTDSNSTFLWSGLQPEVTSGGSITAFVNCYINSTTTSVEFGRLVYNNTGGNVTVDQLSLRYYILQESAV